MNIYRKSLARLSCPACSGALQRTRVPIDVPKNRDTNRVPFAILRNVVVGGIVIALFPSAAVVVCVSLALVATFFIPFYARSSHFTCVRCGKAATFDEAKAEGWSLVFLSGQA